jgi:CopG family transcriptional regulator, nickel-responsive regulator
MQRVTITLDDALMASLGRFMAARGYHNRSEAIRDLTRLGFDQAAESESAGGDCVAAVVYVYDHIVRELAQRLVRHYHEHHAVTVANLHVHLNEESCLEVAVLRGTAGAVRHCAEHVIAERFVRHGRIFTVPLHAEETDGTA